MTITKQRMDQIQPLLEEFRKTYPPSNAGRKHVEMYSVSRASAQENYKQIVQHYTQGQDITEEVLLKLLPHNDFKSNREKGAWINYAPAVKKGVVEWFENAGWAKPEDWPQISLAVFKLVNGLVETPEKVRVLCEEFSSLPYIRGFQTGMITPVLNALRPDEYLLINNKSRKTINFFMETDFGANLKYYPELNNSGHELINSVLLFTDIAREFNIRADDAFDMFTHWLATEKKFWKGIPGDDDETSGDKILKKLVLTEPFSRIFKDYDEACWALDVLQDALTKTGITGPEDQRFAITMPSGGNPTIRIILGNWILIGFIGRVRGTVMQIALTTETAKGLGYDSFEPFAGDPDDPECRLYRRILIGDFKTNKNLIAAYEKSMPIIGERFAHWRKSMQRAIHVDRIGEAVFDPTKREELLIKNSKGLPAPLDNKYTSEKFVKETGFPEIDLNRWLKAIERKKQAIIYGPPGTGKTFVAQAIAKLLTADGDGFVSMVQFHPAYSYEDFIQGIRPKTRPDGTLEYQMTRGRFLAFCDAAVTRTSTCILIIDEINRANLSRVFGELMYLMEYRDKTITLAGGEEFAIPENVRILGTMNTADRSIALVDHALRRRFAFLELFPNFDILRKYHSGTGCNVDRLIQVLEQLNKLIENSNYSLGISYFLRGDLPVHLEDIWKTEIEPYLNEYFFDKPKQAAQFRWEMIKDRIAL